MGRDKALLRGASPRTPAGETRLETALACLEPWVECGWVACGAAPRYGEIVARHAGWELVLDRTAGLGPLAGLAAGLAAGEQDWTLALAVDMPGVGAAEVEALLAAARIDDDVVCFEDAHGPQPLLALYHRRCREPLAAALAAGERRMISFWEGERAAGGKLAIRSIELPGGACPEPGANPLRNVNTPADWDRERAALEPGTKSVEE